MPAEDELPAVGLGLLLGLDTEAKAAARVPAVSLTVDQVDPLKYWLVWDFGLATPKRRSLRREDLSTRSKPRVPVAVAHDANGRLFLAVTRKQTFPVWARQALLGRFEFSAQVWRADLLILAAAGQDTRGLTERGPDHADGNPLNVMIENLAVPVDGLPLPRVLDTLAPLAYMDEIRPIYRWPREYPSWPLLVAHLPYMGRLTAKLLERYHLVRLCTRVIQAETDEDHPEPYFEAQTAATGVGVSGSEETFYAIGAGATPEEATFFSYMQAIRSAVFFRHDVAFCGVLLRQESLTVTLTPIDIFDGCYCLKVEVAPDVVGKGLPGMRHLAQLRQTSYELLAQIERSDAPSTQEAGRRMRGPYLKLIGGMPKDVRTAFAVAMDFTRHPVRLHRLVVALSSIPLQDPPGMLAMLERMGLPVDDLRKDPVTHVHHRHGLGLYNHSWGLEKRTSRQHGRLHFEWSEALEGKELVGVRGVARAARLDEVTLRSPDWAIAHTKTLHTTVRRALGVWKPSSPRPSRPSLLAADLQKQLRDLTTSKGHKKAKHEALATATKVVRELWEAGGSLPVDLLMSLTCLPRSTLYKWLGKLERAQIVEWNKGVRGEQGIVWLALVKELDSPPPRPRRRS